jgi:FkbM family methyltransferase
LARRFGLGAARATARRARLVDKPARFVVRELAGADGASRYGLRASGRDVFIRHRTPDVYALDQAFLEGHFDMPHPVLDVLRGGGSPLRALDLGANIGLFGIAVLERFPDAQLVAFEPDAANAAVLRAVVAANGRERDWQIVEACAAAHDGVVPFEVGGFGISRIAEDGPGTIEMQAKDVFPYLADTDLAKIDIEGAEWEILEDARFVELPVSALHVEYHARLGAGDDPAAHAQQLLEGAGYRVVPFRRHNEREGILWAWREP